jgi:hypothetical protein
MSKRPKNRNKSATETNTTYTVQSVASSDSASLIAAGGDPSTPSLAHVVALPEWCMIRDILGGAQRVREKKEIYLPKFADESQGDYDARAKHAPFVNHFRDNLETIVSKPFSKEVALQGEVTDKIKLLAEDIDGQGVSLHKFARDAFKESVAFGLVGILVDFPNQRTGLTLADERTSGARPYWCLYRAESILALYTASRNGRRYVTHVRLAEDIVKPVGFSEQCIKRVRILNDDGVKRTWQLWEQSSNGWTMIGDGILTLEEIPFRLYKPGEREWWTNATVSPLIDLAYLQIEHYQQSSNLKHVLDLTGFPMLAGNGVTPPMGADGKPQTLKIGPGVVCFAPPQPGLTTMPNWQFIEPAATSIEKLQAQIDKIEQQMSKLGKAPLVRNSGGVTATAEAVNAAKGHAAAEAWAIDLKDTLEECLAFTAMWLNEQQRAEVYIHTDFGVDLRESKENAELMDACEKDLISRDTLWDEWKRRAFLGPQFDEARERAALEKQMKERAERAAKAAADQAAAKAGTAGTPQLFAQNDGQQERDMLGAAA